MSESAKEKIFPFALKNKETALVVGGAGFIGASVCEKLLSEGLSVICIDNLTSGVKENVEHLLNAPNFSFINADINTPGFRLPAAVKVDLIFHIAGVEEFPANTNLSLETLLVNSLGTRVLLEIAKDQAAKFILVSSATFYPEVFSASSLKYYFGKDPKDESVFTYGEAKRFAEALVVEYFKNYGLFAVVTRVKDVYGPRMNLEAQGDLNRLVSETLIGKKLTVAGDGLKILNPTFITDVSEGIVKAAVAGRKGEIYNLINPEKITVASLVQTIRQVVGSVEIVRKNVDEDLEPAFHQPDLTTSFETLSWRPKVALADGVSETVAYFRKKGGGRAPQPTYLLLENKNQPVIKTKENKKKPHFNYLRLVIFLASLLLILITVVYPAVALVFNTYQANRSFKAAADNLQGDRTRETEKSAQSAQDHYQKASQDLQNLSWLLSIFVKREKLSALDDFYFSGENVAQATYSTANGLDILIQDTTGTKLSAAQSQQALEAIKNDAAESKGKLDLVSPTLESLDDRSIPQSLRDDLNRIKQTQSVLDEINAQLLGSTGT